VGEFRASVGWGKLWKKSGARRGTTVGMGCDCHTSQGVCTSVEKPPGSGRTGEGVGKVSRQPPGALGQCGAQETLHLSKGTNKRRQGNVRRPTKQEPHQTVQYEGRGTAAIEGGKKSSVSQGGKGSSVGSSRSVNCEPDQQLKGRDGASRGGGRNDQNCRRAGKNTTLGGKRWRKGSRGI